MELSVDNFWKEAPAFLRNWLSRNHNTLIDAPPGIGKTRAGTKAAIELAENDGHRVLIIEPTKTLREQALNFIKEEKKNIDAHESKAMSDYYCPIINTLADPSLCKARKELCRKEKQGCGVLLDIDRSKISKITVATFSKFLLSKGQFAGYHTFVIDESHGFENAESSFLQIYLLINKADEVAVSIETDNPKAAETLHRIAAGLRQMQDMVGDSTPLSTTEITPIREALQDEELKTFSLQCSRDQKHPKFRNFYSNMSFLHERMSNINDNVFFFYERGIYGRPKNMSSEVSNFFKDKNVALLSATIDNANMHARNCGIDLRRLSDDSSKVLTDYPDIRRKNRFLISLIDGPNLSRSNGEQYDGVRMQSNEVLYALLKAFKVKSLVLFRGYNDHKAASQYLANTDVKDRILNIEQGEEPDQIEEKIKKLRAGNIVLSSASSRLWEGVDIPNLRLVIIDALPYPGKDPLDKEYNFRTGYAAMIKKLKQGLGRIVRSNDDWGAAIVIDRRFENQFNSLKAKLPWYMGEDFKHLTLNDAVKEVDKFVKAHGEDGS